MAEGFPSKARGTLHQGTKATARSSQPVRTLIQPSAFASGKPFLFFSLSTSLPPAYFLFFTIPKNILVKSVFKLQKQYMLVKWYKFISKKSSPSYVP